MKREEYWATGKHTKFAEQVTKEFFLEYNSSIKMYRINSKKKVPEHLMGYSKYRKLLINKINRYRMVRKECQV